METLGRHFSEMMGIIKLCCNFHNCSNLSYKIFSKAKKIAAMTGPNSRAHADNSAHEHSNSVSLPLEGLDSDLNR